MEHLTVDVRSLGTRDVRGHLYIGRVPGDLVAELDEVARREDRTRAAVIRRAIEETVRRYRYDGAVSESESLDEPA
jgi:hypothetical protein